MLTKDREDDASVRYRFGPGDTAPGLLQLDKATGDVHVLTPVPGDTDEQLFFEAAMKVRDYWRAGQFP
ncbi:MAG: hypothetical protein ACT4TC_01410 [Myxococcaceae bacterium]